MIDEFDGPNEEQLEFLSRLNHQRGVLKAAFTDEVMGILEEQFQTELPCFQGEAGQYDPLDAMRRDAHREVLLWVRREASLYQEDGRFSS